MREVAKGQGAIPFDAPGAELHHHVEGGEGRVNFDAFVKKYGLTDPALLEQARIVRGAGARIKHVTPVPGGGGGGRRVQGDGRG